MAHLPDIFHIAAGQQAGAVAKPCYCAHAASVPLHGLSVGMYEQLWICAIEMAVPLHGLSVGMYELLWICAIETAA